MNGETNSAAYWSAVAILAGAVGLGAAQNVVYISSLGSTAGTLATWVGLAVLAAAVKLRVPLTPDWARNKTLAALFVVALVFDIGCAIGHGAISRGSKLTAYNEAVKAHSDAKSDADALQRRLDGLQAVADPTRPAASVRAALDAKRVDAGCVRNEAYGQCPVVLAPLKDELAKAEAAERKAAERAAERAQLAADLRTARTKLEGLQVPEHPDPQARMLVEAFGIREQLAASWQTLLGMLLLELGVIGGAVMANKARVPAQPQPRQRNPPAQPVHVPPKRFANAGAESALETLKRIVDGTVAAAGLTAQGDTVTGSQRAISLACGCSQPTIARWLAELQTAGKLTYTVSGRVTAVKLF